MKVVYDSFQGRATSLIICLLLPPVTMLLHISIDIRKGNGLATLFNTIHDLRFSYFE